MIDRPNRPKPGPTKALAESASRRRGLEERHLVAAELLAGGQSLRTVCEVLAISAGTLRRWRDRAAFQAEMDRLRADRWREIQRKLGAYGLLALDEMWRLATDPEVNASTRQRALADVLNRSGIGHPDSVPHESTDPDQELAGLASAAAKLSALIL